MATRLKDFTPPRGRYPWHEWMDGEWWRVEHGTDFQCKADAFISGVSQRARRAGLKAETSQSGDGAVIHFRFLKPDGSKPTPKRKPKK